MTATAEAPTTTTRAAVWRGTDGISLEDVRLPHPGPGETLVRVRLATVCGSDVHTVAGHRTGPCPSVLGHEAVGEVVAVGAGGATTVTGDAVTVGARVIWGVTVACHRCDRCRDGRTAKCRSLRKIGHEPYAPPWQLSGGYAEHVLLPTGSSVAVVPDALADAVAAPAACATATVMAVLERAGRLAGRRVLVSGVGMLGLTAVAAAAEAGAAEVVAVDVDAARLELARGFGAHRVVLAGEPLPQVDVAVELSGSSAAAAAGLAALDVGGALLLAGAASPAAPIALDPEAVVRGWLLVAGVHNYEPRHLQQAIDFLVATSGHRPWADLVADPLRLDRLGELLEGAASTRPRSSVRP